MLQGKTRLAQDLARTQAHALEVGFDGIPFGSRQGRQNGIVSIRKRWRWDPA
jgi:hypothetical protein